METDHIPVSEPVKELENLHKVTPLSKYLALTLFIILPFVGGWIGFKLGQAKVVDVQKNIETTEPTTNRIDSYESEIKTELSNNSQNIDLSIQELGELQAEIDVRNIAKSFPQMSARVEPRIVGTFNGNVVEEIYWCSDSCPDNGIIALVYQGEWEKDDCEAMGGYPIGKWGHGFNYLGCSPIENPYSESDGLGTLSE